MSGTRAISTTSRKELSSSFFPLQFKAPKEIHAILTETLACFLPGWAKDLSATPYIWPWQPQNQTKTVLGRLLLCKWQSEQSSQTFKVKSSRNWIFLYCTCKYHMTLNLTRFAITPNCVNHKLVFFITVIIANLVHSNDVWFKSALQNLINPNAHT